MKKDYLIYYNDFFLKKIPFNIFKQQLHDFMISLNKIELEEFYDYTTDNPFFEYDSDMVMLTYIYLWIIDDTIKKSFPISGADNMYLSFIRSLFNDYDDFKEEAVLIKDSMDYEIYKIKDIYLIINTNEVDLNILLPKELHNKTYFCINCNDDVDIVDKVELYPYGFMLLK